MSTDTGSTTPMTRLLGWIKRLEDGLLVFMLGAMILLASSQILLRNLFDSGLGWADPLLRIMVLWVGLMGALAASRDNKHISIDLFSRLLSGRAKGWSDFLTCLFSAVISAVVAWHGGRFVMMEFEDGMTGFSGLPVWPFELVIPLAFGLIALQFLIHTIAALHRLRSS